MKFDIRNPIGALFLIYGFILVVYGLVGDQAQYARSFGININIIWGLVLAVLGAVLLWTAWASHRKTP